MRPSNYYVKPLANNNNNETTYGEREYNNIEAQPFGSRQPILSQDQQMIKFSNKYYPTHQLEQPQQEYKQYLG